MVDNNKKQQKPIRILQFTTQLSLGGVQTFLLNYAEHMNSDTVIFDYVVQTKEPCVLNERVKKSGSKIYSVTSMEESLVGYMKDVYHLLKTHPEYKIVHTHLNYRNLFPLLSAKMAGVKVRISHSHSNYVATSRTKSIARKTFRLLLPMLATDYWACSKVSGEWLYGKNDKVRVIHNAIAQSKYKYSEKIRVNLRKEYHIDNQTVWIHVGMFGEAKNHKFLLRLFYEHLKHNPNTVLVLCGDGAEKKNIEQLAIDYGISEKTIFLGNVDNVNEYLMMADIMIISSLYEGLSLACVEAQTAGCPVVASSAVTEEAIFSEIVERCLGWNISVWEKCIDHISKINVDREKMALLCQENGYDISIEAKKLEKVYSELFERVKD